jgi:L,D-peptidoglycan transpeptidase YkuD (ErfK/YbiS/YcfS/YnhG family)
VRKQEFRIAMGNRAFPTAYGTPTCDRAASRVTVKRAAGDPRRGWLLLDGRAIAVALGRGGIKANKFEGDGATPRGSFRARKLWWRADRHPRPPTRLPAGPILPQDTWCEDPASRHYNRPIRLAADDTGDRLTRTDQLYDFVVEIDHNVRPRVANRGSAVFLHLARPGFAPTAGCVAMTRASMLRLLKRIGRSTRIDIH